MERISGKKNEFISLLKMTAPGTALREGLDNVLRDGDQIYFADDVDSIVSKCEELLKQDPITLYAKAARAAKEIVERHTQYHRMKFKLDTVRRYRANGNQLDVRFPFFLPEVDLNDEIKYAVRSTVE